MVIRKGLGIDVVSAAKQRIIDTFARGKKVGLSFSGGKDSLVLAHIIYTLIQQEKINKDLLTVIFIDEEAMYEDVIEVVKQWRIKFMEIGVKFVWYCLQVKHFNCLNTMTNEETFICWDKAKKNVWVRPMPDFAVSDDKFLIPYKDNYQSFLDRKEKAYDMISMRGVRVAESIQRAKNIAIQKNEDISLPIYDFSNKDIWLYLKINNIYFPKTYENLYSVGMSINLLRISQFFSIDTARALVSLGEIYPDLMEKVCKREPNAYLCSLYWDTEMFGRNSNKRKKLEKDTCPKNYKQLVIDIIKECPKDKEKYINAMKPHIIRAYDLITDDIFRDIYEYFTNGDPKHRNERAIIIKIYGRRNNL